jgi:hypothetical protein
MRKKRIPFCQIRLFKQSDISTFDPIAGRQVSTFDFAACYRQAPLFLFPFLFLFLFLFPPAGQSQSQDINTTKWFSLGLRNSVSTFDHDGTGLGTGGQFRIQLGERVNTDWYADYITISSNDQFRSEYVHIGWSVLFYPLKDQMYPRLLQPYILAGHCFDYNKKTLIEDESISKDRWGSAVQAGLGTHFNISERFDVSATVQYMVHLTKEIELEQLHEHEPHSAEPEGHQGPTYEGHMLASISLNYKIFRLWKKS